jgi:hypothetical protein
MTDVYYNNNYTIMQRGGGGDCHLIIYKAGLLTYTNMAL